MSGRSILRKPGGTPGRPAAPLSSRAKRAGRTRTVKSAEVARAAPPAANPASAGNSSRAKSSARGRPPSPPKALAKIGPTTRVDSPYRIKPKATDSGPPAAAIPPIADETGRVRISKLMSERGLCSRREADEYIGKGWVFLDGVKVKELGARALPAQTITLDKRADSISRVTILLHKPLGYVSGQAEDGHQPAITLVKPDAQAGEGRFAREHLKGLAPAGRLDIDSTGLLVFTQDGRIAKHLIGDDSPVDKEYLVRVEGTLEESGLRLLNHGLSLDDVQLRPAQVGWAGRGQLRFVLREGRKRQIRRMCELVGLKVVALKRIRIGNIQLGDLPPGKWRYLRTGESF